jgi:hypothetical protein
MSHINLFVVHKGPLEDLTLVAEGHSPKIEALRNPPRLPAIN